ncbi:MAG: fumarate reductase subunit FrdD [Myxococcota bacterium]
MRALLLKLEPIIWFMFGQGILIGTILLTGWIAVVGLAIPLGIVPADALEFQRAHALGSNIIGRLLLAALVALPLWKGAHHVRSLALDFGGEARDGLVGGVLYAIALAGTVAAILAVVRL